MNRVAWGYGTPRTVRPLWAMIELGLAYDHKKILPRGEGMEDPAFRALSGRHKIPFYQDDRITMGESAAIVSYLADRYGNEALSMPAAGTKERAILQDYTMFVMTEIDARLYSVRLHDEPPGGLSSVYGSAPAAVDAAKQYAARGLREAARWFKDDQHFAMGDRFGSVDILLVSCLDWALFYGLELPAPLEIYRNRLALRPGYLQAMAENKPS
ncbi:MAG: glutathione S-transferase family protein [Halioglobus sp.]